MNNAMRLIGQRLRRRRRELGLSQEAVAAPAGVSFQQLQKYESGYNHVTAARLWRLAQVLKTPVDWFFESLPAPDASEPGDDVARLARRLYEAQAEDLHPVWARAATWDELPPAAVAKWERLARLALNFRIETAKEAA